MLTVTAFGLALQAATCSSTLAEVPPVIGHRGSGISTKSNLFAENTLPSIANAFAEGAEYVEIDVQLSADGQTAVIHDFMLDKTTDLSGCVAETEYARMATADATRNSAASEKPGVPLLAEVLAEVKKQGRRVNIELKVNSDNEEGCPNTDVDALAAAVFDDVDAAGMREAVLFSSFDFGILKKLESLAPDLASGLLTSEGGAQLLALADEVKAAGLDAVNPIFFVVSEDPDTLAALKAKPIQVIPWTVNERRFMDVLLAGGADALITDDVPAAMDARAACLFRDSNTASKPDDDKGCASGGAVGSAFVFLGLALALLRRIRTA